LASIKNDDESKRLQQLKILTDTIELDEQPFLGFENYVDPIVKMVRGSKPNFSVGVYGEWGTGKTSLMRLVEQKLKTYTQDEVLFTWGNIRGGNPDSDRLKYFLEENFGVGWIKSQEFSLENDEVITIFGGEEIKTVESKGTVDSKYTHSLSIRLDKAKNNATLTIDNNIVSHFIARESHHKIDICLQQCQIFPVWFNAWRYEREDQFALIALMKTFAYAMGGLPTYREVKKVLIRGLGISGKDVLRSFAL
jgi:hypothetical protein